MTVLSNFSSETVWSTYYKFHVDPIFEPGLSICSNGHAPLTAMPIHVYGKIIFFFFKTKNCLNGVTFINSCNDRIGKMLHNISMNYLQWLFHSGKQAVAHGPFVLISPQKSTIAPDVAFFSKKA